MASYQCSSGFVVKYQNTCKMVVSLETIFKINKTNVLKSVDIFTTE